MRAHRIATAFIAVLTLCLGLSACGPGSSAADLPGKPQPLDASMLVAEPAIGTPSNDPQGIKLLSTPPTPRTYACADDLASIELQDISYKTIGTSYLYGYATVEPEAGTGKPIQTSFTVDFHVNPNPPPLVSLIVESAQFDPATDASVVSPQRQDDAVVNVTEEMLNVGAIRIPDKLIGTNHIDKVVVCALPQS